MADFLPHVATILNKVTVLKPCLQRHLSSIRLEGRTDHVRLQEIAGNLKEIIWFLNRSFENQS